VRTTSVQIAKRLMALIM
jgi:hypothetical protein